MSAIFDAMVFYLNNTDRRTQLMVQDNTLGRKMAPIQTIWIHNGIMGCLEMLMLDDFFSEFRAEA